MTTRTEVIKEARDWLGTRYRHQSSVKGVACDCIGLIFGVGAALGIYPKDWHTLPGIEDFSSYGRTPHKDMLRKGCEQYAIPIVWENAKAGDIVLMNFQNEPWHMAILGDYPLGGFSLIHAYAPRRKVVEARLDSVWLDHITASYSLPGVTE